MNKHLDGKDNLIQSVISTKVSNVDELYKVICEIKKEKLRIGIDGFPGSGKSTVGELLLVELNKNGRPFELIKTDSFIREESRFGDPYALDYPRLSQICKIESFILEGVCLLDTLDRIDKGLDIYIYLLKQTGRNETYEPILREYTEPEKELEIIQHCSEELSLEYFVAKYHIDRQNMLSGLKENNVNFASDYADTLVLFNNSHKENILVS